MARTDDLRKTLSNATPLYFAAGTADLAAEKLRELPATFDKLRAEAPARIQSVRETELPKLREQAQTLAQQGVGAAREYAAKARETYDELTERGKGAVDEWRSEKDSTEVVAEVIVERAETPAAEAGDGPKKTPAQD
ncbi:hypothetical protein PJ985_10165 [Streptomyces sp. ACA25]|uniref:hypothetical protein n=1 Tax=Streptomyces sp. ACA25 TaxID=3022596 RepID=UPI00230755A0|nr:hypothetical protein [Streptomyces sp. ACA25]MDB1087930.1 hypothetical protein [Streptomyces sp. ACA25]